MRRRLPFFGVVDPSPLPNSLLANTTIGMKGKRDSHYGVLADNAMLNGRKKELSFALKLYLKSWRWYDGQIKSTQKCGENLARSE
jgi:hypothetical protein